MRKKAEKKMPGSSEQAGSFRASEKDILISVAILRMVSETHGDVPIIAQER